MWILFIVSFSPLTQVNILPHFSSSQLSSLNAISSCLPHNPLSHQYISNIMLTKKKKNSYSICNRSFALFPSTTSGNLNELLVSIDLACTCLNFPSFFFERTFLTLFLKKKRNKNLFLPSKWVNETKKSWQS